VCRGLGVAAGVGVGVCTGADVGVGVGVSVSLGVNVGERLGMGMLRVWMYAVLSTAALCSSVWPFCLCKGNPTVNSVAVNPALSMHSCHILYNVPPIWLPDLTFTCILSSLITP
jgi:hypothetical protein